MVNLALMLILFPIYLLALAEWVHLSMPLNTPKK